MKKVSRLLIWCLALLFVFLPTTVLAGYFDSVIVSKPFQGRNLIGVVGLAINAVFGLAGLVALFYLIIGGYSYITAGGDPEAIQMAKAQITNAIIGMVLILASYLIIEFILGSLQANVSIPQSQFNPFNIGSVSNPNS